MLPARFSRRLEAIASDRKSGAIELAIMVVEAFEHLSRSGVMAGRREVTAAVRSLLKAQPTMVPIRNVTEISSAIVVAGSDAPAKLRKLRSFIWESRHSVAVRAASVLPPDSTVITLSRSSTVIEALSIAAKKGRLRTLYVMESRPRLEGRVTAKALALTGIECVMVADAEGPSLVRNVEMAVVGADAVLRDGGIVNKIGTYPLSLACLEEDKPLCVLAESVKLDRRFNSKAWPGSEERDSSELLPRKPARLKALNVYFDLTPPANVSCVVHERGVSRKRWEKEMGKVLGQMTAISR